MWLLIVFVSDQVPSLVSWQESVFSEWDVPGHEGVLGGHGEGDKWLGDKVYVVQISIMWGTKLVIQAAVMDSNVKGN